MRLLAFAVYDRAARAYFAPVFFPTRGLAERWFADMAVSQENVIGKHPGDHELYEVGGFDGESGELVIDPNVRGPVLLTTAVQVLSLRQVANG